MSVRQPSQIEFSAWRTRSNAIQPHILRSNRFRYPDTKSLENSHIKHDKQPNDQLYHDDTLSHDRVNRSGHFLHRIQVFLTRNIHLFVISLNKGEYNNESALGHQQGADTRNVAAERLRGIHVDTLVLLVIGWLLADIWYQPVECTSIRVSMNMIRSHW